MSACPNDVIKRGIPPGRTRDVLIVYISCIVFSPFPLLFLFLSERGVSAGGTKRGNTAKWFHRWKFSRKTGVAIHRLRIVIRRHTRDRYFKHSERGEKRNHPQCEKFRKSVPAARFKTLKQYPNHLKRQEWKKEKQRGGEEFQRQKKNGSIKNNFNDGKKRNFRRLVPSREVRKGTRAINNAFLRDRQGQLREKRKPGKESGKKRRKRAAPARRSGGVVAALSRFKHNLDALDERNDVDDANVLRRYCCKRQCGIALWIAAIRAWRLMAAAKCLPLGASTLSATTLKETESTFSEDAMETFPSKTSGPTHSVRNIIHYAST